MSGYTPLEMQLLKISDKYIEIIELDQGCLTYGPRAKTGPLRGWIRLAGWFCKVKASLFTWEVYPVILRLLVIRFQLHDTLTQLPVADTGGGRGGMRYRFALVGGNAISICNEPNASQDHIV